MAWTTPSTAVAGSTALTAAFWNEQVRDNTQYLKDEADDVGLVHINTTTYTSAATTSLNNVFTGDYEDYLVNMRFTVTNDASQGIRLRAGGVDNTTANSYQRERLFSIGGTTGGANVVSDSWTTFPFGNTEIAFAQLIFGRPALAATTSILGSSARNSAVGFIGGTHYQATAYDGFSVLWNGNATGTISVYGYRG